MVDDYPIQEGDFWLLSKVINDCTWSLTLSMMTWHKSLYWRIRGETAYNKKCGDD